MRPKLHFVFFTICCTICFSVPAIAQDNLRTQLFGETDRLLDQAKGKKADLLAPESFRKGMEYYNEGGDAYKRGRDLEEIREKIKNAAAYFAKALDACKTGEVTFSSTMAARTDADSAGASKSTADLWKNAEAKFNKAAQDLEHGDEKAAKQEAADATTIYRAAELEAIKANYLSPARILLKQADDAGVRDEAPKTLAKARKLSAQVEDLLKQNRYDTDEARQLAQEAKYEAAHALYLYQTVKQMKKDDKTFEDAILAAEVQVQLIAKALGLRARFDAGFDAPVTEAVAALKDRDAKSVRDADSLRQAIETIRQKEIEIDNLKQQVESMEGRVGSLTQSEKDLQRKLGQNEQQEATIHLVSTLFSSEEGNVLRDGDNIVIRLYGLSFPVGKNIIESEFYPLLTKVQDAIKKFPGCRIVIEGHTDSQGSDEANQALSESRAKAVAEYLMANMSVEIPISSQGYGESRPVASNDTPEGRARNRRIDVVITPQWAGAGR